MFVPLFLGCGYHTQPIHRSLACTFLLISAVVSEAASCQTLHSFTAFYDGENPYALLALLSQLTRLVSSQREILGEAMENVRITRGPISAIALPENRHEADERALRERISDPLGFESCAGYRQVLSEA